MKTLATVLFATLIFNSAVWADYDPALEAQEAAARAAAQRASQERQAEADRIKLEYTKKAEAAQMAEKRKYVGPAAEGKSDAEVNKMYDDKVAATTKEANAKVAEAQAALASGQGAAAVKDVTGKSMDELMNMTDEEAAALGAEMEKKYGNGQ